MEPFWSAFFIPSFYQTACSLPLLLLSSYIFIAWKNSFPFIPQMGPLAHRKLASMASSMKAKRLMGVWLGSARVVISSSPETAKEILCGSAFCDRPLGESTRLLMFGQAMGFAPSGSYWRQLRRIASTHMFSPKRVGAMEGVRQGVADEMIAGVGKEMEEKGLVELRGILHKGSLDNVLESVFGIRGGGFGEEMGVMVEQGYDLLRDFNYLGFGWRRRRRCCRLAAQVSEVVTRIITERRNHGDFKFRNDFLSALLTLPHQDLLTDANMVAVLWEMVFRGVDNIYILLEWIMARMVVHQDIQSKVRHEIKTKVAPNRHVEDSDIQNLPYLQAIVKEVLRLHPPGPLLSWARLAVHDVHVDTYFVPRGTTAMVNMWAIAHDPAIWPDPWAFRPDRFLELEGDFSIMGSDLRLAPFGSGRRACPGKSLGLATVHLWLARMLQSFEWLPSQPIDLGECLKLSLEMKKPLVCRAVGITSK